MAKCGKRVGICLLFAVTIWTAGVLFDRLQRNEDLIPFPAVVNQESGVDRQIGQRVWNRVTGSLQSDIQAVSDMDMARSYLRENVPKLLNMLNGAPGQDGFVNLFASELRKMVEICILPE